MPTIDSDRPNGPRRTAEQWREYYDTRFAQGYADHWPPKRYDRIARLVRDLDVPERGQVLDFGCGNGSFTQLLAETLPEWDATGCDVSSVALRNARSRGAAARFVTLEELESASPQGYDLIFSHHVLEHVPDIGAAWQLFGRVAAPGCLVLCVLPCGNPGSLEHTLSVLRRNGIDRQHENRFFCDDEPHLRRLSTSDMQLLGAAAGFEMESAFYNQHFWSQLWPYAQKTRAELMRLTDPREANGPLAAARLLAYRALFLAAHAASWPTLYRWRLDASTVQSSWPSATHLAAVTLTPISFPTTRFLRWMDDREWRTRRGSRSGAEMYLAFRRRSAAAGGT